MDAARGRESTAALTLAALGIVFGDIGTSPLYALKETFSPAHGFALVEANVLGGLSTAFWALMLVVSLKYVVLIMRADNRGEGGIMALIALAQTTVRDRPHLRGVVYAAGIAGAALFYGDAVLTPAISVLSAVEGLRVGTSAFEPYVVPIACGVIVGLFLFQRRGTATVGRLFGPVTVLWFLVLAAGGVYGLADNPAVLRAMHPGYAWAFLSGIGWHAFVVLGAVVLAITGAEALYADMGHFGKSSVRIGWFGLVFPALVLNYFGQGALLLATPEAIENPFYRLYPAWALYPMIGLATAATVIASQATISGAYSLTRQAVQLGFLPRLNIVQTSAREFGQIYIPAINWGLLVAVLGAVTGFGSSSALAGAYGFAVTATMMVDTFLTFFVVRYGWRLHPLVCYGATGFFLTIDFAFVAATSLKIADGGWFPLVIGGFVFLVMTTWRRGRELLLERQKMLAIPLAPFLASLFREPPHRVEGTAVFMVAQPGIVPHALLHNLSHNKVLHERLVFVTVNTREVPWVPFDERVRVEPLGNGCHAMNVEFGFKNRPDVMQALALAKAQGLEFESMSTSFFLSRETVVPTEAVPGMALWRERLYAAMAKNAGAATDFFNLPANRTIELGSRVEI